jgi:large subunit ribosomal protein L22
MFLKENEAVAHLNKIRISPRKLNLVAAKIRGMDVNNALKYLAFSPKSVAKEVHKALKSAVANAENNHNLNVGSLYVSKAYVGQGMKLKRFHARAKGRGNQISKYFSHLSIVVSEREAV